MFLNNIGVDIVNLNIHKTGLIVEGGGMKCAYSAGVLDAFLDYDITFDYCIGVSAGSANAASFVAGQRDRNRRFYTEHIKEPGYFGLKSFLKTGNLFGLQYIYGDLTNSDGADPIDFPAIIANPAEYWLVATNASTGKPEYFSKRDMKQDDYRHIMASCAIPGACRPVEINGQMYYDGGVTDAIPVQKTLDDGCEKIVAILSKPQGYVKKPEKMRLFYTAMCRKYPKVVDALNHRHIMYQKCQKQLYDLEKEGRAFIFAMTNPPKMSTYTMDQVIEQQLYDMGYEDFEKQKEDLLKFLQK